MTIPEFKSGVTTNITNKTQKGSITANLIGTTFTNLADIVAQSGGGTGGTISTGKWKNTINTSGQLQTVYDLSNNGSFSSSAVTNLKTFGDLTLTGSTNGFQTEYYDFNRFFGGVGFYGGYGGGGAGQVVDITIPIKYGGVPSVTGTTAYPLWLDEGVIKASYGNFQYNSQTNRVSITSGIEISNTLQVDNNFTTFGKVQLSSNIPQPSGNTGYVMLLDQYYQLTSNYGTFMFNSNGALELHAPFTLTSPFTYQGSPSVTGTSAYILWNDNGTVATSYGVLQFNSQTSKFDIHADVQITSGMEVDGAVLMQTGLRLNGVSQPIITGSSASFLLRDNNGAISSLYSGFKYDADGIELGNTGDGIVFTASSGERVKLTVSVTSGSPTIELTIL